MTFLRFIKEIQALRLKGCKFQRGPAGKIRVPGTMQCPIEALAKSPYADVEKAAIRLNMSVEVRRRLVRAADSPKNHNQRSYTSRQALLKACGLRGH